MKFYKKMSHRCFTREYGNIPFQVRSTGHYNVSPADRELIIKRNFFELYWGIEGEGEFQIDGGKYRLHPGEVCFYTPGDLHQLTAVSNWFQYRWMTFDGSTAEATWKGLRLGKKPRYAGNCPEDLFSQLVDEVEDYSPNGQRNASATAFRILMLSAANTRRRQNRYDCADKAKQIIDSQFRNSSLSICSIAEKLAVDRSVLCRKFHSSHGVSPAKYLINQRILHGMHLLESTDKPVREIAFESGFSSPNYFTKCIKKYTGTPTKEFRLKP